MPDGDRLYLPTALPGERVVARPMWRRGDGWVGVVESFEAGPGRRDPPCAHFPRCGGCAVQHLKAEPYLDWKAELLGQALSSAGYDPVVTPARHTSPRTRRRADLAIRREGNLILLGLHERGGAEIVDLIDCHVLHEGLFRLSAPIRAVLRELTALKREGSLIANLLDSGPDLLIRTDGVLTAEDRGRLAGFAQAQGVSRISWARNGDAPETACELRPATTVLSGVTVRPPPGAFLQASAEGETAIIEAMRMGLADLPARARVADLYAGCGTLTFPIARSARVTAYEGNAAAADAARQGANASGLAGRVEVTRRDLVRQPLTARELAPFAAVVLDPPHAGAALQVAQIARAQVGRVIYVSCNPATLGRDASILRDSGYTLDLAVPIDQFLWSARLESVCVFKTTAKLPGKPK